MLQRITFAALLVAVTYAASGCSKSDSTAKLVPESDSEADSGKATDINSVKAISGEGNGLTSPAKQSTAPKVDPAADPATVTSKYLGYLEKATNESESLAAANELLTAEARSATHQANVDVSLPGSENAAYIVHQAKYVTSEQNVAHVLTSWTDSIDDDEYKYDVTWILKKQSAAGWRIAGMITNGETPGDTIVFNFEDAADIANKGAEASETQVAGKGDETIR